MKRLLGFVLSALGIAVADYIADIGLVPYIVKIVAKFLMWIWTTLISSYSLPGWALLIIFAVCAIGLARIYLVVQDVFRKPAPEPEYRSYIEDFMFGARWHWKWVADRISDLSGSCPLCQGILVSPIPSPWESEVHFICENCRNAVRAKIAGTDRHDALAVVKREIIRRVKTGEYRKNG